MNIYFAGSIAGGQEYLAGMKIIVGELRSMGHHIMTGFVIGEPYEDGYPTEDAWARDIPLLQECDAIVAEISQRSDGVGIELGISAVAFGKKVLCLRDISLEGKRLSQLITKGPFKVEHYNPSDKEILRMKLADFLQEIECSKEIKNEIRKEKER